MRILLTGGAGFIGSWVADYLIEQGHDLHIIDNLSTGSESNIPHEAEFIKCDIRDNKKLDKIFKEYKPECVNHHAAQINVRTSVDNPAYDADINIIGTLNLLELSRRYNVNRFIFASSGGAIYGDPDILPADEHTPPMPISPYGISKYSIEKYLYYYYKIYGIDFVSLRYANVYGPRQNPHGEAGVIAIFCSKILESQPCMIYGDGKQTRDYVYVSDVAKANVNAMIAPTGTYNIGTSVNTSVLGLVDIFKTASNNYVIIKHLDARPGEVQDISLTFDRYSKTVGWNPEIDINNGINKTWSWFKSNNYSQNL